MQPNNRLKSARMNAGWTQEDVADMLDISAMTIYRWERGETTPNAYFRERLCRLFRLGFPHGSACCRSFVLGMCGLRVRGPKSRFRTQIRDSR